MNIFLLRNKILLYVTVNVFLSCGQKYFFFYFTNKLGGGLLQTWFTDLAVSFMRIGRLGFIVSNSIRSACIDDREYTNGLNGCYSEYDHCGKLSEIVNMTARRINQIFRYMK